MHRDTPTQIHPTGREREREKRERGREGKEERGDAKKAYAALRQRIFTFSLPLPLSAVHSLR
jgi:hypothetical protein